MSSPFVHVAEAQRGHDQRLLRLCLPCLEGPEILEARALLIGAPDGDERRLPRRMLTSPLGQVISQCDQITNNVTTAPSDVGRAVG
jgi:hypothetical protein